VSFSRLVAAATAVLGATLPSAGSAAAEASLSCADQPRTLSAARFRDNGDGTVTDTVSQLMWMRCAVGQRWSAGHCEGRAALAGWDEARRLADAVNRDASGFFNDWRMPSLRELATITERGCTPPRTNGEVFPQTPAAAFWSATARPGEAAGERVFVLSFGTEGVQPARKDERHHVRLVRTGP
jgi:hypothetical protein